jgi:hypothetical protein
VKAVAGPQPFIVVNRQAPEIDHGAAVGAGDFEGRGAVRPHTVGDPSEAPGPPRGISKGENQDVRSGGSQTTDTVLEVGGGRVKVERLSQCVVHARRDTHEVGTQLDRARNLFVPYLPNQPATHREIRVRELIDSLAVKKLLSYAIGPPTVSSVETSFVVQTLGKGITNRDERTQHLALGSKGPGRRRLPLPRRPGHVRH